VVHVHISIFVRTGGLERVLHDLEAVRLIYLREDGADIRGVEWSGLSGCAAFILGDHMGMMPEEEMLIEQADAKVVSLGQRAFMPITA